MSVLNDFQVCGLVESLIGVTNDFGAFGTEPLVDRFLRRSGEIMREEELEKVEPEKQKVQEDAAASLGLSVSELRERLESAAKMNRRNYLEDPCVVVEEVESSCVGEVTALPETSNPSIEDRSADVELE